MDASPRGVPTRGYTEPIASRYPRIQVPRDPALDQAITTGRDIAGPSAPVSQVVRALAIRGAQAYERERSSADEAKQFLLDVSAGRSGLDLEALKGIRDRAWR